MRYALLFATFVFAIAAQATEVDKAAEFRNSIEQAANVTKTPGQSAQAYADADKSLRSALSDPRFAELDAGGKASAYSGAAWAAIRSNDVPRARDMLALATQADPAYALNWLLLAQGEDQLGHHDASAEALTQFLDRDEHGLEKAEAFIPRLLVDVDPASNADLAFLRLLARQNWQADDESEGMAWEGLALAESKRGDSNAARAALARIRTPSTIVEVRSDKRFDGLYDPDSTGFDPVAVATRRVEELQDKVNADPNRLKARIDLGKAMESLGRYDEVVKLSDYLVESVESGTLVPEDPGQLVWVRNQRAGALLSLGRIEEGLAPMREAAATAVDGRPNVNQALNLAGVYCELGRGPEAVAAAKSAGAMNGYGRMVQAFVLHCGAWLAGDRAQAQEQIGYLREHRSEGRGLYTDALMQEERLDEAAADVIERLASEKQRGRILLEVQDFRDPPSVPPNAKHLHELWDALLARADVHQALEHVGRRSRYEILN
jgi:hypothetical protein